jgi:hypothetical protein
MCGSFHLGGNIDGEWLSAPSDLERGKSFAEAAGAGEDVDDPDFSARGVPICRQSQIPPNDGLDDPKNTVGNDVSNSRKKHATRAACQTRIVAAWIPLLVAWQVTARQAGLGHAQVAMRRLRERMLLARA